MLLLPGPLLLGLEGDTLHDLRHLPLLLLSPPSLETNVQSPEIRIYDIKTGDVRDRRAPICYLSWLQESPRRVPTEAAGPGPGAPGQSSPLLRRVVQAADGSLAGAGHEGDDGQQGRSDGPRGLPGLGVVAGYGQADLLTNLKPAIRLQIVTVRVSSHFSSGDNLSIYLSI